MALVVIGIQIALFEWDIKKLFSNGPVDDAFYYFKISENVSHSFSLTFDQLNVTNGFHPLWLLLLLPLSRLFSGDNLVIAIYVFQIFLIAASAALAVLIVQIVGKGRNKLFLYLPVFVIPLYFTFRLRLLNGLEQPIQILVFMITILAFHSYRHSSKPLDGLILGTLLSLCFLARTDSIIFVLLLIAYLIAFKVGSTRFRFATIAVASFTILSFTVANYIIFGSPVQVSGATKSVWASYELHLDSSSMHLPAFIIRLLNIFWPLRGNVFEVSSYGDRSAAILLLIAIIGLAHAKIRNRPELILLNCYLIIKYLYYALSYDDAIWYYGIDLFVASMTTVLILIEAGGRNLGKYIVRTFVVGSMLFLLIMGVLDFSNDGRGFQEPPELEEKLKASSLSLNEFKFPSSVIVGMSDAGIFGFYSRYRVVNLDGLVNGSERLRMTKQYVYNVFPYLDVHPEIEVYIVAAAWDGYSKLQVDAAEHGFEEVFLQKCFEKSLSDSDPSHWGGLMAMFVRKNSVLQTDCPVSGG